MWQAFRYNIWQRGYRSLHQEQLAVVSEGDPGWRWKPCGLPVVEWAFHRLWGIHPPQVWVDHCSWVRGPNAHSRLGSHRPSREAESYLEAWCRQSWNKSDGASYDGQLGASSIRERGKKLGVWGHGQCRESTVRVLTLQYKYGWSWCIGSNHTYFRI